MWSKFLREPFAEHFSYSSVELQLIESGGGREMRKYLQMIRISFGDLGQLKKTKQGGLWGVNRELTTNVVCALLKIRIVCVLNVLW